MTARRAIAVSVLATLATAAGIVSAVSIRAWANNPYSNVQRIWQQFGAVVFGGICVACTAAAILVFIRRSSVRSVTQPAESPTGDAVGMFACPCCGHLTLPDRGGFEICEICRWQDDGQDDHDADVVRGGPNGSLSLTQARENFSRTWQ